MNEEFFKKFIICVLWYSQFSLFMVVLFYKFPINTEYEALLLGEVQS